MRTLQSTHQAGRQELRAGSVLIGVLWCVVLLSITMISMLHATRLELRITKNHADATQAYYLAVAGVEKAKAVLYTQMKQMREDGRAHSTALESAPEDFRDVRLGRGFFRVVRAARPEDTGRQVAYGLANEEACLNVNYAGYDDLLKVPGMTPDVAAAIVDWRDEDSNLTPGGAEKDDYLALSPPYVPADRPLTTTRELLRVRGMPPARFFGEDANGNRLLDVNEDDGPNGPPDDANGFLDAGWSSLFTVHSGVRDVTVRGQRRVSLQTATEDELRQISGIDDGIAKAIVEHRSENQFESIAQLLDVRFPRQQNRQDAANQGSNNGGNNSGSRAVGQDLLKQIADEVSAGRGGDRPGVVNVNAAPKAVLACLPQVTEPLAAGIVSRRKNRPFVNVAELLDVSGMTEEIFKAVCPRVTTRGETYRVISEGVVPTTGARRRIEAVLRYGAFDIETLYYREEL